MMRILIFLVLCSALCATESAVVTIYSDGYAVIRENRSLNLAAGDNTVTISDLPKNVLGESFQIGGRGVALRQFNFLEPRTADYSFEGFLKDARGKLISFRVDSATVVKGKLLQATDSYVFVQSPDSVVRMFYKNMSRDWSFVNPTFQEERKQAEIRCELNSASAGSQSVELRYEGAGMQWDARYRLLLNDDSTGFLEGWASILNRVGKSFENCEVVLVEGNLGRYKNLALGNRLDEGQIANIVSSQAGFSANVNIRGGRDSEMIIAEDGVTITSAKRQNVQLDVSSKSRRLTGDEVKTLAGGDASTGGYQSAVIRATTGEDMVVLPERAPAATYSSERHGDLTLYSLPFEATLKDSAQTEVVLLERSRVKAYQIYSFNGLDRSSPAAVTLQLVNKEQEGLGLALPAAELQLFRSTKDGLEQFVGSHRLERTAAGDTVRVNLGGDPEIMCASKTLSQTGEKRTRELEFEHTLKSSKSDTVAVSCQVRFNGELTVEAADVEYNIRRRDDRVARDDLHFTMILPPNEEIKSKFKVRLKLPK